MSGWFVVTGSSKGVGLEICRLLLKRPFQVIGLSRNPGPLRDYDGFTWLECDLSCVDEIRSTVERIGAISNQQVDGLVFNAAAGYYGRALGMEPGVLHRLVTQNFTNQVMLLKLLGSWLSKRADVFYISTSASRIPAPMMAAYTATKMAFESFLQSVAMEEGLRIHIARPAEIDTGFSWLLGIPPEAEGFRHKLSPRTVAEKTLSMLKSDRIFRNIGYRSKMIDLAVRICPALLLKRSSKHLKVQDCP